MKQRYSEYENVKIYASDNEPKMKAAFYEDKMPICCSSILNTAVKHAFKSKKSVVLYF